MHVPGPFGNFTRRIISQPIVPGMKSGLAAADRIILIPPRVVIVWELVQHCRCRARTLIFESVGIDAWRRLCDQRLVGNVRITLRWRLRQRDRATDQAQDGGEYPRIIETHEAKCNSSL